MSKRRKHKLKASRVRELLTYDPLTGLFRWRKYRAGRAKAGTIAGTLDTDGYRQIRIDGVLYLAHRLAWLYVHGRFPHSDLDHWDLDRDNNAIENLRPCTESENTANTRVRSGNILGRKGVTYDAQRRRYRARIRKRGRLYHLGWFEKIEDAAAAYAVAAIYHFRKFARSKR